MLHRYLVQIRKNPENSKISSRLSEAKEVACQPCEGDSPLKTPVPKAKRIAGRVILGSFVFAELLLSRASPELA